MHDPAVFEKPMDFIPERYLKDGKINTAVRDPESGAFGYGRRSVIWTYLMRSLQLTIGFQYLSWSPPE